MSARVSVTVTIEDIKVSLEGPEEFVREEIERLVRIRLQRNQSAHPTSAQSGQVAEPENRPESERHFIAQKAPKGHPELVTVLGYFLSRAGQEEFTAEDIKRAYKRAGQRPPKVMEQALRDAKNVKDYLQAGSSPGKFRLTSHGERTVEFDLPRVKPSQTAEE